MQTYNNVCDTETRSMHSALHILPGLLQTPNLDFESLQRFAFGLIRAMW